MYTKQTNRLFVAQILTLILVVILLVDTLSIRSPKILPVGYPLSQPIGAATNVNSVEIDWKNNYVFGKSEAPNFLIVYSNYDCGICGYFYKNVFDSLKYMVDRGELKIVCKSLVDENDRSALLKAKIAEVARQANHFPEVHEMLLHNERISDSASLINNVFSSGISKDDLRQRMNSAETMAKIQSDNQSAKQLNIIGTPSFVINGKVIPGYMTYKDIISNL